MLTQNDALVATFARHREAETAIRRLDAAKLEMRHFSIVGKDNPVTKQVVNVYNADDLIRSWQRQGSMSDHLWGVFFGCVKINLSEIGPVIVVGHLTGIIFTAEGPSETGALGLLGSAFHRIGLPQASDIRYEDALKCGGFLIIAHGPAAKMAQARAIVATSSPINIDLHRDVPAMPAVPDAPF